MIDVIPRHSSMIRHIAMFSSKEGVDREAILKGLSPLTKIPHAKIFEIALNEKTDPVANDIDVVVYAEFDDEWALEAYRNHPVYRDCITVVRPIRELRMTACYDTGRAITSKPG